MGEKENSLNSFLSIISSIFYSNVLAEQRKTRNKNCVSHVVKSCVMYILDNVLDKKYLRKQGHVGWKGWPYKLLAINDFYYENIRIMLMYRLL